MTPQEILSVEQRLNITLPEKYRQSLLEGVLIEGRDPPAPFFFRYPKELLIANLELREMEAKRPFGDAMTFFRDPWGITLQLVKRETPMLD